MAQAVWYIKHGEDLNNSGYFLKNTCGHKGCSNPDHYEKVEYKNPPHLREKKVRPPKTLKDAGLLITMSQFQSLRRCPEGFESDMASQFRQSGIKISKKQVEDIRNGKIVQNSIPEGV